MKIVFIIDQVYLHGGIERVLSIKANYLASDSGNEIHILTTEQKENDTCYPFNSEIVFKDLNINYHRNISYFHPKNLIKLPNHIYKLKKELISIKPDVVVVCSHSADTYFIPLIKTNIPKIKEFHYSKYIEEYIRKSTKISFKKIFLKFADFIELKYDKLVVLNKTEGDYYKTNNFEVIPNPLTFYPEHVSKLNLKKVVSVGRIAPVKGFEQLIDIWEIVNKSKPDWKLEIYGDGEQDYVESLQNRINEKELHKSILLKGPSNNIEDIMLQSSIFAMTSHNECFPLVLLEAQASGLPCISFNCPHGPKNIISKNNGILVEQNNINSFSEQLILLMNEETKRKEMGKEARLNTAQYRVENVMELWVTMFLKLTK